MNERSTSKRWVMLGVYVFLCLLIVFVQILPLSTLPSVWAWPDLIFALTFVWAGRRPDLVPIWLVAPVLLFSDLIFYRPPGLWAFIVLVVIVRQKRHAADIHDFSFITDYINYAVMLTLATLAYRIALAIFFIERDPMILSVTQIITSLLAYPLVVGLSYYIFRVRPPKPGDRTVYKGLI